MTTRKLSHLRYKATRIEPLGERGELIVTLHLKGPRGVVHRIPLSLSVANEVAAEVWMCVQCIREMSKGKPPKRRGKPQDSTLLRGAAKALQDATWGAP